MIEDDDVPLYDEDAPDVPDVPLTPSAWNEINELPEIIPVPASKLYPLNV